MGIEKPVTEITLADLTTLIDAAVREGKRVEYKRSISIRDDDGKRKFLSGIASFANAVGGDIIFGMRAEDGIPMEVVPLTNFNPDQNILTLRDLIRSHISPTVFGVEFRDIQIDNGFVLIVRVPKSWSGPHMVTFNGDNRFYTRSEAGNIKMNLPEIRAAFFEREGITERIRRFRIERLSKIKSDDLPAPVAHKAKWVSHLIPLQAFEPSVQCDLSRLMHDRSFKPMGRVSQWGPVHDLDGFYSVAGTHNQRASGYSAILRNGCAEIVEASSYVDGCLPNPGLEQALLAAYASAIAWMPLVRVEPPAIFAVSLLDVKQHVLYHTPNHPLFGMRPIRHEDVPLHEILVEKFEPGDNAKVLRPIFDAIWQACGLERSLNFNEDGQWRPLNWI